MTVSSKADDPALSAKVAQALARMSAVHRNILLLNHVDGHSYEEIAAMYGVSRQRIERSIARTMYVLAREVFDERPQPFWRRYWPL